MADSEERKPGIDSGTGTAPAAEATGTPADESGADAAPATEATGAPADESGADAVSAGGAAVGGAGGKTRSRIHQIRTRNRTARRPRTRRRKDQLLRLFRGAEPHLRACRHIPHHICSSARHGRGKSGVGACAGQGVGRFQRRDLRRAVRQGQIQERQQIHAVAQDVGRGDTAVGHPAFRDTCRHLRSRTAGMA